MMETSPSGDSTAPAALTAEARGAAAAAVDESASAGCCGEGVSCACCGVDGSTTECCGDAGGVEGGVGSSGGGAVSGSSEVVGGVEGDGLTSGERAATGSGGLTGSGKSGADGDAAASAGGASAAAGHGGVEEGARAIATVAPTATAARLRFCHLRSSEYATCAIRLRASRSFLRPGWSSAASTIRVASFLAPAVTRGSSFRRATYHGEQGTRHFRCPAMRLPRPQTPLCP